MKLSFQILLAFALVLLLSILDTTSNYLLSLKVKENSEFLSKSQEIIRNSGKLHKAIIEMQSSFRGFLLAKDTNFLSGYKNGLRSVPAIMAAQRNLVTENAFQGSLLDSIENLHHNWIDYANSLIVSSKSSTEEYTRIFNDKLRKQYGKKLNDQISQKFREFDRSEYKIREIHSARLFSSIQTTHTFSFIFFALTIIIGIATTIYIIFLITTRIKSLVKLAENISKGNFTTVNDTRKDELTRLTVALNTMSENLNKNINELEKRNAELDKFAYVVSHDLKAPIRGIHNVVQWIEEDLGDEVSPRMREYLNIIPERTKRMEDLINGLLAYARLREKTIPEITDVNNLVHQLIQTIVPREFKVGVTILPLFVTERLKLEQVFANLISNAVKYTPKENGKIIISCETLDNFYQFSVKDNGIGIEPEYHEKIFELFQTLREKEEAESTGIGLSIIKKIIEDQHGTIFVKSELGKGAEFIFTWPKGEIIES